MAIFKEVLFNDGEAADVDDFNNAQRFLRAQASDILVGRRTRNADGVAGGLSFCFGVGVGADIQSSGTALRTINDEGCIVQVVSSTVTGDDSNTLLYYLAANELQTDHGAAHATQDRWDIVCIKLENIAGGSESRDKEDAITRLPTTQSVNKRRNIVLTKQVVVGANAAAGTAVEPAVPAGFVKWAAVFVPAAYAAAFNPEIHFRNYRVPCGGIQAGAVHGSGMINISFGTVGTFKLTATATNQQAVCILPRLPEGRILRLQFRAKITAGAGAGVRFGRFSLSTGGFTAVGPTVNTGGVDSTYDMIQSAGRLDNNALYGPGWLNGSQAGPSSTLGHELLPALLFESGAVGDTVSGAVWHVATG